MTYTNFPNGVTSFGIPLLGGGGIPVTKGNVYFVDYGDGSDGNRGKSPTLPFKTLDKLVDVMAANIHGPSNATDNTFDVGCLIGHATHVLSNMWTQSLNRCVFIGLDGSPGRYYGQNAKVQLGVTTSASDLAALKITGIRNVFQNIKFISNNTKDESLYTVIDAGEYTQMINCEVYKSTDLDVTGAAEFVSNGDSGQYIGCTFGSLADARSGAVIRPTVLFTKGIGGTGKVTRDAMFSDCNFWIQCTNTANRFMYGANDTDIERICTIKNSRFIANGASSAIPAQNVAFGSALTVGSVLIENCVAVNAGTAMSTTTGVFVYGPVPAADTTGIALQAT